MIEKYITQLVCSITSHQFETKQHDIHQKFDIYAVCNYRKCTRCDLEIHNNSIYCNRVLWNVDGHESIRPEKPTKIV